MSANPAPPPTSAPAPAPKLAQPAPAPAPQAPPKPASTQSKNEPPPAPPLGEPVPAHQAIWPNVAPQAPAQEDDVKGGTSLMEIVKKLFHIADGLEEPTVTRERNVVSLVYPDDSMIRIVFEHRGGRHGGVSTAPIDEASANLKNDQFKQRKEQEDAANKAAADRKNVSVKGEREKEVKDKTEAAHQAK